MTAKTQHNRGLGSRSRRSLVQRGVDVASEYADLAAQKLGSLSDPRARLLRKRRWALRLGLFFGFASVFWALVTGLLAAWSTPVWALLITGLVAAGAAVPATLWLLRYRWLRGEPLPPRREVSGRRMPPHGSAARPAMSALGASERGLHSLLAVLHGRNVLPPQEIEELTVAAGRAAATMAATSSQLAALETVARVDEHARSQLAPTINALTGQLNSGVRQYNEMVTAAAQVVSAANGDAPVLEQRYRHELADATDRLSGWAQAFDELGALGRS